MPEPYRVCVTTLVLRTLGGLDLRDGQGLEIGAVLRQPKRLALFAYLAIASPRHYRRDSLLAMFWPEMDEEHARAALRRSLHFLRAALGADAIEGRGEDEVRVPADQLWCDAVAFEQALRSDNLTDALQLYGGDLLEGLHIPDAPAFQDWLDTERTRLRELAVGAAWLLAAAAEKENQPHEAGRWGRRAFALTPTDEGAVRRLMKLLDQLGDSASALAIFDRFARRIMAEDNLSPVPETLELVQSIRSRPPCMNGRSNQALRGAETFTHDNVLAGLERSATTTLGTERRAPTPSRVARRRHHQVVVLTAAVGILGIVAALALRGWTERRPALDPRRVVVAPFQNLTGVSSLDHMGLIAADWIGRGLSETGLVQVVDPLAALPPMPRSRRQGSTTNAEVVAQLGSGAQVGTVVAGSYYRQSDTLYFEAKVIDPTGNVVLAAIAPTGALESEALLAVEELRQRIMAALAFRLDPRLQDFTAHSQPPTYKAYRHFVQGMSLHITREYRRAAQEFIQAAEADSQFRAPLIFAALDYFNLAHNSSPNLEHFGTADSIIRLVAQNEAQLSHLEHAILEWLRAKLDGNQMAALDVSRRFAQLAPGTLWEYQSAYDALLVNRPLEAVEILSRVDPDRGLLRGWLNYWSVLALAYHLLGDHDRELHATAEARERYGGNLDVLALEMGAMAATGRLRDLKVRVHETETSRPAVWASPGIVLMLVGLELARHGHAKASQEVLSHAIDWYRLRTDPGSTRAATQAEYGEVLYAAGQWQAAGEVFESLAAQDSSMLPYQAFLGLLAARRGDTVEANRVSQWLATVKTPYIFGHPTFVRARIASLLGHPNQAVALLRQAFSEGLEYGIYPLHSHPDLDPLRGYPPFEELLRPKS